MKQNFWRVTVLAMCVGVGSLAANAASLQRGDVMADPAWVVHLDLDALRPTAIGQFVLGEMDKPDAKPKLAALQTIIGVDPRTQLHGVTLYGASQKPEGAVLIVYADFDAERLMTLARASKDYQTSEHNKHTISTWIDENKKGKEGGDGRVYATIQGNRVLFGQREERVAAALDVIDGKGSSLAKTTGFPELGMSGSGHFIEAAARKMEVPDSDPNAAILKMSKSLQLVVGVKQKQIEGALTLNAESAEVAGHVLSVAQGLTALMKLQTNKPEAVKLANAIVIKQDGSSVLGTINLSTDDVLEALKATQEKKAAEHDKEPQ
jgi:hypothetical protein